MQPIRLLLVEDNPADVDLTLESLETSRLTLEVAVVRNGAEALDYLFRRGDHAGAPRPDLVLLDLNLPRRNGREVLGEMKEDPELCRIPVVVLTSSDADADIIRSYELGANCYVTKPTDLQAFEKIVHSVEGFWFTVVELPTRGRDA